MRAFKNVALLTACAGLLAFVAVSGTTTPAWAQPGAGEGRPERDESGLRPFADVSKGFDKVVTTVDGQSYFNLWKREKDGALLAEFPRGWEGHRMFFAVTLGSGEEYAGLQVADYYLYWKRQDNKMVLIEPNLETRASGEAEVRDSVKRIFTDRVVLDVPVVAMGPSGQPLIDMKALLLGSASKFFGGSAAGANPGLATLKSAKGFKDNVEISYEMPTAGGRLKEFHWSISVMRDNPSYKPREADERLGYFTTVYRDLSKWSDKEKWVRYINRWQLEKRDPKLRVSPPKQAIVFHIEHTVPVRYRKFVREGILEWNKAFEKVGISDAIEVYQQDADTRAHMDKDPEDVNFNFVRWLANDQGTAIGPSRVHPLTGQIVDADIILTDGWIRHFWSQFNEIMPELAMEGMSPETLAWLERNPQWDPRIRLADPAKRDMLIAQRLRRGVTAYGGHPIAMADPEARAMSGQNVRHGTGELDGLVGRTSQFSGLCMAARGKAFDMAVMRMALELLTEEDLEAMAPGYEQPEEGEGAKDEKSDEKKDDKKKKEKNYDTLDGVPDWFVGPLLRDLVAHEVGHTLGLRHNFKASSIYTLAEINSEQVKGKKTFSGSVMDYIPINMTVNDGKLAGDIAPLAIGPYDFWVIEYGYTSGDLKDVLKRVSEPELVYLTDEDVGAGDPLARRYDFAKDPIAYAKSQMDLARFHRERLLDKFVKDGESWAKARRGYQITLGMQTRSLSMMANWVGGVHVNRARKGDPNAGSPLQVVPVEQQREALRWTIDNAFFDESFGLTTELLQKMTVDKWLDAGGFREGMEEPAWPVHDRVAGVQSAVLTMLLNPTTVRRVYDNEFRVPSDQDALTLPELFGAVTGAIWSEIDKSPSRKFTARQPMISSLRRNLQHEHIERMIDLSFGNGGPGEASKAISNLSVAKLREIKARIDGVMKDDANIDPYSKAHLSEARTRIEKALDAGYVYNAGSAGGGLPFFMFGNTPVNAPEQSGVVERDTSRDRE